MSLRSCRILFLAFLCLWLNVLLPGHTRGRITLGDAAAATGDTVGACCEPGSRGRPTPDECGRCAVCHLAMTTEVTPPITFDASPGEDAIATVYATDPQRRAIHLDLRLFATGPPPARG